VNNSETAWVPAALMNTATGRKRRQIHVVPAATAHGGTAKAACRESPDPKFNGWNLQAVAHRKVTCELCKLQLTGSTLAAETAAYGAGAAEVNVVAREFDAMDVVQSARGDPDDRMGQAWSHVVRQVRMQRGFSSPEALSRAANVDRNLVRQHEAGQKLPTLPTLLSIGQALRVRPGAMVDRWAQLVSEVEAFSRRPEGWQVLSSVDVLDVARSADSIDESDAIRWFVDFGDSACWTAQRAQRLSAWLANAQNVRSLIELQEIACRGNAQSCIIGAFLKFIGKLTASTESLDVEVAKPAAKWLLEVMLACLAGAPRSSPWRPVELSQWLAADPQHDATYTRLKQELQNKLELLFGQPDQLQQTAVS
jgi:ribosome-binding protein aMBF1 (putative translation factor)